MYYVLRFNNCAGVLLFLFCSCCLVFISCCCCCCSHAVIVIITFVAAAVAIKLTFHMAVMYGSRVCMDSFLGINLSLPTSPHGLMVVRHK